MNCPGISKRLCSNDSNAKNPGERCDSCTETALEDVLLAVRVLHDPEDDGSGDAHPDVIRAREALEPYTRKRRRRDMLIGAASFGGGVL